MLAPRAIRLDVRPSASLRDPRCLRTRTFLRGAEPAASDPCRLQLCTSAAARLQRGGRALPRPRRRDPHLRPRAARSRLSVFVGTQVPWRYLRGVLRIGLEKAYPQYAAQVS